MKKNKVLLLLCFVLASSVMMAQNNEGKADDAARIAITPQVSDQEIPQSAKNMLVNKMRDICTKNGMSGSGENPFFVMDASVDVLSKELTPTAPPMHAMNLSINLEIKDNMSGNVYSQTSIEVKGVGKNETKAYMEAIKHLNTNSGQFKAFVEKGKSRILEFYNSECDFVLSKAKALQAQGENNKAIQVLESVPSISKECYDMCMELLAEIEPQPEAHAVAGPGGEPNGGSMRSTGGNVAQSAQEIDEGIYLVYTGSKDLGNTTKLYFQLENRAMPDYEFQDFVKDSRLIDADGREKAFRECYIAGSETGAYPSATLIDGTPVPFELVFEKADDVSMFEFKYKGQIFRFKDIQLSGSAKGGSAERAAPANARINVGDRVYVNVDNGDFAHKKYVLGKVKTLATPATKNEFEVMPLSGEDITWTSDIITSWHAATKEDIKDGVLVIYTIYEGEYYAGYIISTENLYKNLISVKGRYNDVRDITIDKIIIPDSPVEK